MFSRPSDMLREVLDFPDIICSTDSFPRDKIVTPKFSVPAMEVNRLRELGSCRSY